VVTGASDGIGRAIATELASHGLHVVLVARRQDALEALSEELSKRYGVLTTVVAADMAEPDGIAHVKRVTARLACGLFVAAAGFGTSGSFVDNDLEDELDMIDVNCRAVASLTHAFAKRFAAQRRGGIVLMSSLVAFQGVPRAANYAATKAYVQSLAEALRVELRPFGVEVLASAPGPVHSGFAARASMTMGKAADVTVVAAQTVRALGVWGTVRPGWLAKLLEWSLSMLPRWGRVRMMGVVMQGMARR
jgi:hypothetical protein